MGISTFFLCISTVKDREAWLGGEGCDTGLLCLRPIFAASWGRSSPLSPSASSWCVTL